MHIQGISRWKRDKQVENGSFYLNKETPTGRKEKPGAAPMGWKRHLPGSPRTASSCQVRAARRSRGDDAKQRRAPSREQVTPAPA